jgi:hypothetical protein
MKNWHDGLVRALFGCDRSTFTTEPWDAVIEVSADGGVGLRCLFHDDEGAESLAGDGVSNVRLRHALENSPHAYFRIPLPDALLEEYWAARNTERRADGDGGARSEDVLRRRVLTLDALVRESRN